MTVYTAPIRCITTHDGYRRVGVDSISFLAELGEGMRFRAFKIREAFDARVSASGRVLRIELNPSYATSPGGLSPCSFEEFGQVMEVVWDEVARRIPILGTSGDARVTRLDLARDFDDVHHLKALIEGLRNTPRGKRVSSAAFMNVPVVMWKPNGLVVGGRERVSLYDRHLKVQDIPQGVVRFEARLRARWLKKAGVTVLDDVTREVSLRFLLDRWEWSRFGGMVVADTRFIDAVDAMPWTDRAKAAFYWDESKRTRGLPVQQSPRTVATRRRQREQVGASAPLYDAASVRLDFRLGSEVATRIRNGELDPMVEAYTKEAGDVR